MNTSKQFKDVGLKVVAITEAATIEAKPDHITCRGVFEFEDGDAVAEIFTLKDGAEGRLVWSYKPTGQ